MQATLHNNPNQSVGSKQETDQKRIFYDAILPVGPRHRP